MRSRAGIALSVLAVLAIGCSGGKQGSASGTRLTLAGNSVSRQLFENGLIPAFKDAYAKAHPGYKVEFTETYEGSGAQERAIEAGLNADIAALSMGPEIDKLVTAGLADKDWNKQPNGGVPATSLVVIVVRKGNPKNIKDWDDLTNPGIGVVLPNPDTSGAAKWNVVAMGVIPVEVSGGKTSPMYDLDYLRKLRVNIKAFGKSGKEAQQIFSSGLGDALIGWESEALDRIDAGDQIEVVYPSRTIRMEPPVAVITPKGQKTNPAADEFVKFLSSPEAQKIYVKFHYRPRDTNAGTWPHQYPYPDPPTIEKYGGWDKMNEEVFGPNGIWPQSAK